MVSGTECQVGLSVERPGCRPAQPRRWGGGCVWRPGSRAAAQRCAGRSGLPAVGSPGQCRYPHAGLTGLARGQLGCVCGTRRLVGACRRAAASAPRPSRQSPGPRRPAHCPCAGLRRTDARPCGPAVQKVSLGSQSLWGGQAMRGLPLEGTENPEDGCTSTRSWFLWGGCCPQAWAAGGGFKGPQPRARTAASPGPRLGRQACKLESPWLPKPRKVPESWAWSCGRAVLLWGARWPWLLGRTTGWAHRCHPLCPRGLCSPLALGQLRARPAHETLTWPRLLKVWEGGESCLAFGHILPLS